MSNLGNARAALDAGELDRARQLFMNHFDQAPGESAFGLARIALRRGDFPAAEQLARTARENGAAEAVTLLADAIGRQGRREEAERTALDALSSFADSGVLRAVLGEQRIRQGEWDLGTQDFIDALTLDGRGEVVAYLHRVIGDMTRGHAAGKVPKDRAMAFINRVEYAAPQNDPHLPRLFAESRRALNGRQILELEVPHIAEPPAPSPTAVPSSRSVSPPATMGDSILAPGAIIGARAITPALVATMQRDRKLNETLQRGIDNIGLPVWPSENRVQLDTVPPMCPTTLQIDPDDFRKEHLHVTTGSIASEIILERALQTTIRAAGAMTATAPTFDEIGLTQLELALSDGVVDAYRPIPDLYFGEQERADTMLLGLGSFLGECVVRRGTATWAFAQQAQDSVIETGTRALEPFAVAREWFDADDRDDVHLERLLGEARVMGEVVTKPSARLDPTEGLRDRALSMKLAELWLAFRAHPLDTAQTSVATAIRPLNVLDNVIFFSLDAKFAPPLAVGSDGGGLFKGDVAMAYARDDGEFLCLGSRKHFARAVGRYVGDLTEQGVQRIVDMFSAFHRPHETIIRQGEHAPSIERRGGATILTFHTRSGPKAVVYSLVHQPNAAIEWRLVRG